MSGQQIGTVIGGAIGAYFGGPAGAQLGMAIGGLIGGAVDPTHINGPKIGDGQQQAATDGAPIAWVQGTALIAGTIVQVSKRRQIRHKDSGKGGPVVTTYTAEQDFAVLVCESCELRDSTMSSVLMVLQDGKLVYDVRPGSTMLSDSAKWKSNVDFMFGGEDQMPHPTLEAITGVGSTPAYRGSLVAVFKNFDVSQAGDRIPSFQFVVSSSGGGAVDAGQLWRYKPITFSDPNDYSAASYDDSGWAEGLAPFGSLTQNPGVGTNAHAYDARLPATIATNVPLDTGVWMRRVVYLGSVPAGGYQLTGYLDNYAKLYVNGVLTATGNNYYDGPWAPILPASAFRIGPNVIAIRFTDDSTSGPSDGAYFDFRLDAIDHSTGGLATLAGIVTNLCARGGLDAGDIDVTDYGSIGVPGYPIARQSNAADCLLPLLQAYFGYASEYDAKLHFSLYGDDASVIVDRADLIEGNDANNGAITSNLRNQATEFPRRVVGSYMDPAQNYTVVDVAAERRAVDVIAIGDQAFQIPVVMSADDAAKAVDKALKVAYATLEGTQEYVVPFAGTDVYLSIVAGEAIQFQGKRWVPDEMMIGNGNLKLTTRYDRQSAYVSKVQAILGNAPSAPTSPYSGPTTLIPMNLPSLRPQDTYGLYLAAASQDGQESWRGCTLQISYDNQASWQTSIVMTEPSIIGALTAAEPVGGEPLTVQANDVLESVTDDQIVAQANAFALIDASTGDSEVGQFKTATETANVNEYELTGLYRAEAGSARVVGAVGDQFVMLESVYFLPIDISFSGKTLYLRAVGFGELAEDATIVPIVYNPDTTVIQDGGLVTT